MPPPTPDALDEAFVPPGEAWNPVSPKLATARRITLTLVMVPILLVLLWLAVAAAEVRTPALVGAGIALVVTAWLWWLIGRRVRSFG